MSLSLLLRTTGAIRPTIISASCRDVNVVVNAGANIVPMLGYGQLQFHSG